MTRASACSTLTQMRRWHRGASICWLLLGLAGGSGEAVAGLEDWQVNEVHPQSENDTQIRFVELYNELGGCLFPSSTLRLYDAEGALLSATSLSNVTTCYGAPTYLLLATQEAADFFGVNKDRNLLPLLPPDGQLCFVSSTTRYDCVRWGQMSQPLADLVGSADLSLAPVASDGESLIRVSTTHVVLDDWAVGMPTPRAPNDGGSWNPPDAGPTPDASPIVDAGPAPDAALRSDAGPQPDARPDAGNNRYLDLDTVGGAACGCQSSKGHSASGLLFLLCALLLGRRERGHRRPD